MNHWREVLLGIGTLLMIMMLDGCATFPYHVYMENGKISNFNARDCIYDYPVVRCWDAFGKTVFQAPVYEIKEFRSDDDKRAVPLRRVP